MKNSLTNPCPIMSSPKNKSKQKDRDKKREDLEKKRKPAAKQGNLNPKEGGGESIPPGPYGNKIIPVLRGLNVHCPRNVQTLCP